LLFAFWSSRRSRTATWVSNLAVHRIDVPILRDVAPVAKPLRLG
jgi:hypothetical protein